MFEADSSDDGDVNIYHNYDIAMSQSNEYRRKGYKSRIVKLTGDKHVVYFKPSKQNIPKVALSRRFNGKDYYPERNIHNDVIVRSREAALDKVKEYNISGYYCRIIDFLVEENLAIIYLRQPNVDYIEPYNIVIEE